MLKTRAKVLRNDPAEGSMMAPTVHRKRTAATVPVSASTT